MTWSPSETPEMISVSVKAGIDWQNMTEIISGVSEGDQVIVAYDTMPSDGDKAILYKKKL